MYITRNVHYIGDGDTESFKKVLESKSYENDLIPTVMCWPLPKEIGNKIMKITKWHKGKKMSNGKEILGKERFTEEL